MKTPQLPPLIIKKSPSAFYVYTYKNKWDPEKILFLLSAFWKDLISRKSSPSTDEGDDGSKALPEL